MEFLLVTRYSPERVQRGEMLLRFEDVQEILSLELIGVIPESTSVLNASTPGTGDHGPRDSAGQAYSDMVSRYLGEDPAAPVSSVEKGLLGRLF